MDRQEIKQAHSHKQEKLHGEFKNTKQRQDADKQTQAPRQKQQVLAGSDSPSVQPAESGTVRNEIALNAYLAVAFPSELCPTYRLVQRMKTEHRVLVKHNNNFANLALRRDHLPGMGKMPVSCGYERALK